MIEILLSAATRERLRHEIAGVLAQRPHRLITPDEARGAAIDIAFISRDVTGGSSKTQLERSLLDFYVPLRAASRLTWVHTHSAGADRPIFPELLQRGVRVTTSSGANAPIVAQTAVGAVLALARRFPRLAAAQRDRAWRQLLTDAPPPLAGQTAVVVGFGPIGQRIAKLLEAFELNVRIVRRSASTANSFSFDDVDLALHDADWLILACPLTPQTDRLIDARRLGLLADGAHVINVARGEVLVQADLIDALAQCKLAGAYLDVFEQEPLVAASPLWDLPNVIVSPHSAGHSSGNAAVVDRM
ncbi:D-2-hydroxyacid dehydrogenase [Burkholderia sp. SRS-W-2-2016]|uniref:D-2-hydroxyacid dehydrogenase n=1 Tax=Burkholderia sp. SRS-W-2-2016 TaxID=1926878 RepID=UPI000A807463|nr:D-2-hydroxyacid dehydrogenase [Burkholderia sp. SRS-W-2-2016]